jgi:CRISPR-associated protein Csx17
MPDLQLDGCSLEPLGDYLKAIGVLRLLGAQVDPTISGRWDGDTFVVTSDLSRDELCAFFVERYVPTPIITPWNSGSGFGEDDAAKSKTAFEAVTRIADSADARLAGFREAIRAARRLTGSTGWGDLDKQAQVTLCRNTFPDAVVDWIDAAVVLTSDSRSFPPLLGTGGNDGRLDFGSNVMQRLIDVLGLDPKGRSVNDRRALVGDALFATGGVRLDRAGSGQFDPSATGGPGSGPLGAATSLSNPWSFVLAFEGAVAFASGVARKLGSGGGSVTSVPFTVSASSVSYASAAAEKSRGEFWAPVWNRPTTSRELIRMIGEARVEYRGRQVRNGSDFARALAAHGVDQGIDEFVRYGFLERNGLATFCVPLGRRRTTVRPGAEVLGQVDEWVSRVRRVSNRPASADALLGSIDRRQFSITSDGRPAELQGLLEDVAALEHLASRSNSIREAARGPVSGLRANDWLPLLADGTQEFDVALGIASLRAAGERWGFVRHALLDHQWRGRPPAVQGFGQRPLTGVLADCVREISIRSSSLDDEPTESGWCGRCTAMWVGRGSFTAFARGELDDQRVQRILAGLLLLDWRSAKLPRLGATAEGDLAMLPAAVQVLKPVFHHGSLSVRGRRPVPDSGLARLLSTGQPVKAIESALRSLRIAGVPAYVTNTQAMGHDIDAARLAATCLVPISDRTALEILKRIADVGDLTESETAP